MDSQVFSEIKSLLTKMNNRLFALKPQYPKDADDPMAVRLSNGKEFYEAVTQIFGNQGGGGGIVSIPKVTTASGQAVAVANPDGSAIGSAGGGSSTLEAEYNATPPTLNNGEESPLQLDINGNLMVTLGSPRAGEDFDNDVQRTEQQFLVSMVTSDTAVMSVPAFLHTVTFACNDAAPTAGTIDIYNNSSGSGTKIFSWTLGTTAFMPFTLIFDCEMGSGIYVDFTTTNDVNVTVTYR